MPRSKFLIQHVFSDVRASVYSSQKCLDLVSCFFQFSIQTMGAKMTTPKISNFVKKSKNRNFLKKKKPYKLVEYDPGLETQGKVHIWLCKNSSYFSNPARGLHLCTLASPTSPAKQLIHRCLNKMNLHEEENEEPPEVAEVSASPPIRRCQAKQLIHRCLNTMNFHEEEDEEPQEVAEVSASPPIQRCQSKMDLQYPSFWKEPLQAESEKPAKSKEDWSYFDLVYWKLNM